MPKIVDVHELRKNPELSKGYFRVMGKVEDPNDRSSFFLLSDLIHQCKKIPVIYKGQKPDTGTEVIAYGNFRKVDRDVHADALWWEFFLDTDRIEATEETFSNTQFYLFRKSMHKYVTRVYRKCKICQKIKTRLFPTLSKNLN
jgi:hypothetical protein